MISVSDNKEIFFTYPFPFIRLVIPKNILEGNKFRLSLPFVLSLWVSSLLGFGNSCFYNFKKDLVWKYVIYFFQPKIQ